MKFESAAQDLEGLPHVVGSLSNLGNDDRHLAERMRKAIDGEMARRYRLFKDAGARDANEYEEMRLAGRDLQPVPILLVIIDEYLELFHHHPEWIDLVIHIGQEGRGCNVFFTLGGQRLDLSSLSKAKSNIAFRVALRAETAEDSPAEGLDRRERRSVVLGICRVLLLLPHGLATAATAGTPVLPRPPAHAKLLSRRKPVLKSPPFLMGIHPVRNPFPLVWPSIRPCGPAKMDHSRRSRFIPRM
jgi:hypothetical protein